MSQDRADLFVVYAEADRDWVEGFLLGAFDAAGVRYRTPTDFELGVPTVQQFEAFVKACDRTLLVISPAFRADRLNEFADLVATTYSLHTERWRVIPLLLRAAYLPDRLAILERLDMTDPGEWQEGIARLCRELKRPAPGPARKPPCPYPGMRPFGPDEAGRFFGRRTAVTAILQRLRVQPVLALVGPSGSGKSSLVEGGVVPRLVDPSRSAGSPITAPTWRIVTVRPGAEPVDALAGALRSVLPDGVDAAATLGADRDGLTKLLDASLAAAGTGSRGLLVVDQFEEVFAQCKDAAWRQRFLDHLGATIDELWRRADSAGKRRRAASDPAADWLVVLAIRADFYAECQESTLWPRISTSVMDMPSLDESGLREAIVEPARAVGVTLDPALVDALVRDTSGKGALGLLQEALVLLWADFSPPVVTLADYEKLGGEGVNGVQRALRLKADAALGALRNEEERAIARRVFLRLVELGEGRKDTRRQQPVGALATELDPLPELQPVLDRLIEHGLLAVDRDPRSGAELVDLSHELLIDAWPQLRRWLDEHGPMESQRRGLAFAASGWHAHARDPSYLFSGGRLREAAAWAEAWPRELGSAERAFLAASARAAARHRVRRWVGLGAVAVVGLSVALAGSAFAYREWVGPWRWRSDVVLMAAGPADLGTDDPHAGPEEGRARTVTLLAYRIEDHEVTFAQYDACVQVRVCSPVRFPLRVDRPEDAYPVVQVTADQAQAYCAWVGRRLPTTAEWEHAAIVSGGAPPPDAPFDEDATPAPATWAAPGAPTAPVAHLVGNVSEWAIPVPAECDGATCHTGWSEGLDRVAVVGGSFDWQIERLTEFNLQPPDTPRRSTGFRCVEPGS